MGFVHSGHLLVASQKAVAPTTLADLLLFVKRVMFTRIIVFTSMDCTATSSQVRVILFPLLAQKGH